MKPIVLEAQRASTECIGLVRLSPEAERIVRRLNYQSGIPIRRIVSEIIVQAEGLIEIRAALKTDDADTAEDEAVQ